MRLCRQAGPPWVEREGCARPGELGGGGRTPESSTGPGSWGSGTQRPSSLPLIPSFVPELPPQCHAFQPWAGWDPAGLNRTNPAGLALPLTVTRRAVT